MTVLSDSVQNITISSKPKKQSKVPRRNDPIARQTTAGPESRHSPSSKRCSAILTESSEGIATVLVHNLRDPPPSEPSEPTRQKPLHKLDQQSRDQKATKSDDAPVPTDLWKQHLINDGPSPWSDEQASNLDVAMNIARKYLLRVWKRRTRLDFLGWWTKTHAAKAANAQEWATHNSVVSWNYKELKYQWDNTTGSGRQNFRTWHSQKYRKCADYSAGRDCLCRAAHSSWWEWTAGSRPMFWRWPLDSQADMRDGMMVFFICKEPRYLKRQQKHRDPHTKKLVEEKLQKVIDRGYLDNDQVIVSLTSYFPVEKGSDDIRIVYDGTKCGLNDSVWVPSFLMPTLTSHLRAVVEGTNMCDVDIGECFLNFMLHPNLRTLCGIDLGPYDLDFSSLGLSLKATSEALLAWNRAAMGMKWSPYQAVRSMHYAEEVIRGDRHDPKNVFRWDEVRCNLPGQDDYDPSLPWVSKVKVLPNGDRQVAADLFTFVDDLRPTGNSNAEAWKAGRRSASVVNWLGCQDAPRKRRDSSTSPGAWAGSLIRTTGGVFALVSEEKWAKFKTQVEELGAMLDLDHTKLSRKRLEQIRGFMGYVVQTYRFMIPYLNGLHMTIDGWREGRDEEGWKLPPRPKAPTIVTQNWSTSHSGTEVPIDTKVPSVTAASTPTPPKFPPATPPIPIYVAAVPRLSEDVAALLELSASSSPPLRKMRPGRYAAVMYGFGDASGPAFGATSQFQSSTDIHFEFGQWITSVTEEESSNWREFTNVVEYLESRAAVGELNDAEVFMFTDNSTTDAAFWKGTSKSKKLLELVLRLRKLEMSTGMILHIIHVSGKRMIAQGTDGLSRGDHSTGVMTGQSIASFVPLHLGAFDRSPALLPWIKELLQGRSPTFLTPEGWYDQTDRHGTFVWAPPPAAADLVVERFCISRHKRPNTLHVLLIPRLMTARWRKQLVKHTDAYCRITCAPVWNMETQFEPLLMFVAFPYLPHLPRFRERKDLVDRFERLLCGDEVSPIHTLAQRNLLRQFFFDAGKISSV